MAKLLSNQVSTVVGGGGDIQKSKPIVNNNVSRFNNIHNNNKKQTIKMNSHKSKVFLLFILLQHTVLSNILTIATRAHRCPPPFARQQVP